MDQTITEADLARWEARSLLVKQPAPPGVPEGEGEMVVMRRLIAEVRRLRAVIAEADELLDNWGRPSPLCKRDAEILGHIAEVVSGGLSVCKKGLK